MYIPTYLRKNRIRTHIHLRYGKWNFYSPCNKFCYIDYYYYHTCMYRPQILSMHALMMIKTVSIAIITCFSTIVQHRRNWVSEYVCICMRESKNKFPNRKRCCPLGIRVFRSAHGQPLVVVALIVVSLILNLWILIWWWWCTYSYNHIYTMPLLHLLIIIIIRCVGLRIIDKSNGQGLHIYSTWTLNKSNTHKHIANGNNGYILSLTTWPKSICMRATMAHSVIVNSHH